MRLLLLLGLIAIVACADDDTSSSTQLTEAERNAPLAEAVETTLGPVLGTESEGIRTFKGIPFATAPVGARRFTPPEAIEPWTTPLAADQFGPACMQSERLLESERSEDCLNLNVWAPNRMEPKPVMVWIYGGAFSVGTANIEAYNGTNLAKNGDVVVVSMNYRVGVFGFLPIQDDAHGEKRILGLLDQQLALQWVRDNIAQFGGDPNNVTLFGESAGGVSICTHLGMPSSDGLFHKAIIQSGAGCRRLPEAESRKTVFEDLLRQTSCESEDPETSLVCLRELDADALYEVQAELEGGVLEVDVIWPLQTNTHVIESGRDRRASGNTPKVPVLIGSTLDEFTFFTTVFGLAATTEDDYNRYVALFTSDEEKAEAVRGVYNENIHGSFRDAINAMTTDAIFTCPLRRFAVEATLEDAPVFVYQFQQFLSPGLGFLGSTHTAEIPYVFGQTSGRFFGLIIDVDEEKSREVQAVWSDFARDGMPNSSLNWTPYTEADPAVMLMKPTWELGTYAPDYDQICPLLDQEII